MSDLAREATLEVAQFLKMPKMDVYSAVTFYNLVRLNPRTWSGGRLLAHYQLDPDTVSCICYCAMAPVIVIDNEAKGKGSPIIGQAPVATAAAG